MAEYTIELRKLLNLGYHLKLDTYPIFNEEYRPILNQKIINHFYYREIGQETPDRFNFMLERKMHEIMPYYNQLYRSEQLEFDPLASEYYITNTSGEEEREYKSNNRFENNYGEKIGDVYTSNIDGSAVSDYSGTKNEAVTGNTGKSGSKINESSLDKNENSKENITSNSTTTNNLTTTTNNTSDGNGTNDTTGNKNSVFSDIPQAGFTTTTTIAPDGTITEESTGYATTSTVDTTREHNETTTHQEGNGETKNTGTVTVEGTSEKITDTTTTQNETGKELYTETGMSNTSTDYSDSFNKNDTSNTKEDTQRNTITNRNEKGTNLNNQKENNRSNSVNSSKGRRGVSPSSLLKQYRDTFLNVDLLVIDELEPLFMGVY